MYISFLETQILKKINFIWRLDVYYTIKFTINRTIHNIMKSHDKSNDEKTNDEKTNDEKTMVGFSLGISIALKLKVLNNLFYF